MHSGTLSFGVAKSGRTLFTPFRTLLPSRANVQRFAHPGFRAASFLVCGALALATIPAAKAQNLSVNGSLAFPNTSVGSTSSESIVVYNPGSGTANITGISEKGTDFAVSSVSSYAVGPNQSATIDVNFDPHYAAVYGGHVWIYSTDSSGNQNVALVWVHGNGTTAAAPAVSLDWEEPTGSPEPIAGYIVFRSASASGPFTPLDSGAQPQTSYVDENVTAGSTYYYQVESVGQDGTDSNPSSTYSVTVPGQ